jgi:hypothetical protein
MRNRLAIAALLTVSLSALLMGGCATYYSAGDRGVYYERPPYRASRVVYVDPLLYPYWSLDYFYYSRYYHPFSVVVHRYDPWYYPSPGWYYGYWPGPRFAGHYGRHYYPWTRFGGRYAGYHPWRPGLFLSFGYFDGHRHDRRDRIHELDARLGELETRRSLAVRSQRPGRGLTRPVTGPWIPATGRSSARSRDGGSPSPNGIGVRLRAEDLRTEYDRRALLERLRAADRSIRPAGRDERLRRSPVEPPRRSTAPREPVVSPAPPSRQRPVDPSPPRSRPPRRPERETVRPPRPQSSTPSRNERRERR